ncbi:MAG: signal recognition particle protein [Candidatus Schekmanbacteria bacterium]|nr:signal recognition particle protein [Candidatus Schekmanbacteria bacterium]
MFENLSKKLETAFAKLRKSGKLNEHDVKDGLKEVKMALLEADVNYKVVKDFIASVEEKALGQEVLKSLSPGQQIIKIVNEEIIELLGHEYKKLELSSTKPPAVILLLGLQGSGKTTTAGKLARMLKTSGHNPMLVSVDVYRPAAMDQLKTVAEKTDIDIYPASPKDKPLFIAESAYKSARDGAHDILIIDTAGRLHIDNDLMDELKGITSALPVSEKLLVSDSMTGQDAVNIAREFDAQIGITGIIMTKMDGDARGGAALSMRAVTGKPIKFITTGEKPDAIEPFHPERIASRILGMGDVLTLIEKAQSSVDEEKARALQQKIREETFTLEDFKDQLLQIRKMGPIEEIMGMIPGMGNLKKMGLGGDLDVGEKDLKKIEAIISSMTARERANYTIISGSRRKRISKGSGTTIQDVNRLIKQFAQMKKMLKTFSSPKKMGRGMKFPFMKM